MSILRFRLSIIYFIAIVILFSCSKDHESFDESADELVVNTIKVFDIGSTSAKLISEVTMDVGQITSKGICYGIAPDPTIMGNKTNEGGGNGSFVSKIENLNPGIAYFARAYAINESGVTYGQNITFNTNVTPFVHKSLHLESQKEVDLILKSGISTIEGDLIIGSKDLWNKNTEIISLPIVSSIKDIKGSLRLINTKSLKSLEGFENIERIGGDLEFSHNEDLISIESLKNINRINGNIIINNNENLKSLEGLESIEFIEGVLNINNNASLENISDLKNLSQINNSQNISRYGLSIYGNPKLNDLSGLEQLKTINGATTISNNTDLVSLKGLDNLALINGNLYLYENYKLKSFEALASLTTINDLYIFSNDFVSSLKGFENLKYHPSLEVSITHNKRLSDFCDIKNALSGMNCNDSWRVCSFSAFGNGYDPQLKGVLSQKCKQ